MWNGKHLLWMMENPSDLTTINGITISNYDYYYQDLPEYLHHMLPLLGTNDIMTSDNNTLYLPEATLVYMIRHDNDWVDGNSEGQDLGVDLSGWRYTRDNGDFLGPSYSTAKNFKIYRKVMQPGIHHEFDDNAALYLFVPGKV